MQVTFEFWGALRRAAGGDERTLVLPAGTVSVVDALEALAGVAEHRDCGALSVFAGTVRNHNEGGQARAVAQLHRLRPARGKADARALLRTGDTEKGDPIKTARIAGILAAKRTDELIPLCHRCRSKVPTCASSCVRARSDPADRTRDGMP